MRMETHFDTISQLRVKINLAYCQLNAFLEIIRLLDEERLRVY